MFSNTPSTAPRATKRFPLSCYFFLAVSAILVCGCGGAGGNSPIVPEEVPCDNLVDIPPRGLSCLHCTQPEARSQATTQINMLLNSCIKNVAINYLVDGTFSFDQALLQEHISSLTSDGRQLHVVFFLSNGPAQRRWSTTSIEGFGTKISPEEFRFRIQTDSAFQEEYKNIVRRLTPVLETAISGGAQVYLIPALEDNLTVAAFEAMRRLTLEAIPAHLPVSIGRNPSTDYANSDPTIPAGVFVKEHIVDLPMTVENGFVSNDGYDYFSPGTGENPNALVELNHLRIVRKEASALGSIFILWSARAQGLQDLEPLVLDTVFPDPANRDYQIPNKAEQQEIHAFLRENLN